MPVWRRLVEPVAAHIADAMEGALNLGDAEAAGMPGMAGMEQMLRPMLRTSGASMFGLQLGQGLGQLAAEVVGATDIGLPLSEPGHVALLPTNVEAFGEGLDQSSSDVTLYLALRECARQRLFAAAGWLREQMLALVEQYASGITIDTSALEEAVGQVDPNNLAELSSTLEGGLFEPQKTPGAAGHAGAAGDDAGPGRGLGRRGGHPGHRAADAVGRPRWPRPYAGPGRPADRPRRRSRPWSVWSCGRAGCGTRPTCGPRCATPAAPTAGTRCGPTRIWCPPRPIWTIRWASSPPNAPKPRAGRRLRRRPGRAAGLRAGRRRQCGERRLTASSGLEPVEGRATSSGRIWLVVGLPGSGKTTEARRLAAEHRALRLSPDEWMLPLFGDADADGKRDVLEGRLISLALQALALGVPVVLDFGFWSRAERSRPALARGPMRGGDRAGLPADRRGHAVVAGDRPFRDRPGDTVPISRAELAHWRSIFEEPDASELTGGAIDPPPAGWPSWSTWAADRWPSLGA